MARNVKLSELADMIADGAKITQGGPPVSLTTARRAKRLSEIEDGDFASLKELVAQLLFELDLPKQGYDFEVERNTAGQMTGIKARPVGREQGVH